MAALLGVLLTSQAALGSGAGKATASHVVSSASWAAVASTASAPPYATAPLTLGFGATGRQVIYFDVVNTGQLTLTGASYTLSGANLPSSSTIALYACVGGTWNQSTNTCSGTITSIVTSTGSATTVSSAAAGTYPAAVGARVTFAGYVSRTPIAGTTGTVAVAVTRSTQVAAGKTSNS